MFINQKKKKNLYNKGKKKNKRENNSLNQRRKTFFSGMLDMTFLESHVQHAGNQ